jgi:HTH-type transcriptional regulator/antitoxin HigA
MQNIHPIKTEADYQAALKEIENLFDSIPDTPRGDRLDILATLIEAYEDAHFTIPAPDPIEALLYFVESRGLTRKDLEPYIGYRARVSEILNRQRPLTLRMIQRLHSELGVPAEILVRPYPLKSAKARKSLPVKTRANRAPGLAPARARGNG